MKKFIFIMPLMAVSLLASCSQPKPQVIEHFVSFDSKGGDYVKTQRVKDGDTATEPNPEPTRDNDEFKGWFTDDGTFQKPYMFTESVTDDVTLYAKWHEVEGTTFTVTFMNGDSEYKKIEGIEPKQHISSPGSPTKDHYNFIGWCTDAEGKNKFDFAEIEINQNYTLYAGYEKNCTIIFKNNGSDYASAEAIKGTAIPGTQRPSNPTNPPVPGQTFIGWGYDTTGQHMINDLATAKFYEETTTLHANWTSEPIPVTTYTINFNCTNCKVYDETGTSEITSSIDITVGQSYTTYCKFMLKGKDDYKAPFSKSSITVKKTGDQDVEFYYDGKICEITVPIHNDLTITSSGINKTLEESTWAEISEISTLGRADEFFDTGNTKKVEVNGKDHDVRIIGFNHDDLVNGGKAGITFEFANLISDSDGFSLATSWNWEDGENSINENYLDSNLRKAIDGGGARATQLEWYQINGTKTSENYKTSVLDMITSNPNNEELKDALKEVRKPIAIKSGTDYIVDKTSYTTKLFPLSYREMTEESSSKAKDEGTTYEFYKGKGDTDINRVKWQVNHLEGALDSATKIEDKTWEPDNNAGYNYSYEKYGAEMWTRSPCIDATFNYKTASRVGAPGRLMDYTIFSYAYAVAPAFCI